MAQAAASAGGTGLVWVTSIGMCAYHSPSGVVGGDGG
jgi:hypothetical protein